MGNKLDHRSDGVADGDVAVLTFCDDPAVTRRVAQGLENARVAPAGSECDMRRRSKAFRPGCRSAGKQRDIVYRNTGCDSGLAVAIARPDHARRESAHDGLADNAPTIAKTGTDALRRISMRRCGSRAIPRMRRIATIRETPGARARPNLAAILGLIEAKAAYHEQRRLERQGMCDALHRLARAATTQTLLDAAREQPPYLAGESADGCRIRSQSRLVACQQATTADRLEVKSCPRL